jgi:hypothetical protein
MSRSDRSSASASGEGVGDATRASADGGATLGAGMAAAAVRERVFRRADILAGLTGCR